MSAPVLSEVCNQTGFIILNRAPALNSLSLEMVRDITNILIAWHSDPHIKAVVMRSNSEKAFCAGGDIRFFHQAGIASATGGAARLEDFFTEEYALNHLIHHYPKPYVALMDGVVMGGGMGIAQAGPAARIRIVTERTKMAMPEVAIGLFPDVGGGYFLSRAPGQLGTYLGVTGETIGAADAIYADLADVFISSSVMPALIDLLAQAGPEKNIGAVIADFAAQFSSLPEANPANSRLANLRAAIDQHFAHDTVAAIITSLAGDASEFTTSTHAVMHKRSPLMMSVTLAQLRRSAKMSVAQCLKMERTMVRHCFAHGEVIEGVRALVIDKDHAPKWNPATLEQVTTEMVERFFESAWPDHAHPLKALNESYLN